MERKFFRKYPVLGLPIKSKDNYRKSCLQARLTILNATPAKKQTNKHKEHADFWKHFSHSTYMSHTFCSCFDCQS